MADAYLKWKYSSCTGTVGDHAQAALVSDTANDSNPHLPTNSLDTVCVDSLNLPPPHPPSSGDHGAPDIAAIGIAVIDIYTLSTSVKVSRVDDETTAVALASLGFIGNAPFNPSVAVSMKTLELYRVLRRRKASFSVEGFVKVICDLYGVGYFVPLPLEAFTQSVE